MSHHPGLTARHAPTPPGKSPPNAVPTPQTPKPWNTPRHHDPTGLMPRQRKTIRSCLPSLPPRTQKRPTARYAPWAQATQMQLPGPRPQNHKSPEIVAPPEKMRPPPRTEPALWTHCLQCPPGLKWPKCRLQTQKSCNSLRYNFIRFMLW